MRAQSLTPLLNLSLDVWEMVLQRLSGFTVLQLAFLVGNRHLSMITINACQSLVFSSKPYHPPTPFEPILINRFKNLRLLHITYPTGTIFRSYEFLSTLPSSITDLAFHFPASHDVWVVSAAKTLIDPKFLPEWFDGPSVIRIDKVLPNLQSLQLLGAFDESGYAKNSFQLYTQLRTKFLSKMPKSLTKLRLSSKLIDELPRLPKHVTDVSFVATPHTNLATLFLTARRHAVGNLSRFSRKPLRNLSLHLSTPISMLPDLPNSVTALECLPYTAPTPNYYELDESTSVLFPPYLTSLSLLGRDTYWETVELLPRTLLHLSMNVIRWKSENSRASRSIELFPPKLTSLSLLCNFFSDVPPIPPTVTKLQYRASQGKPTLHQLGKATSITINSVPIHDGFPNHVTFLDLVQINQQNRDHLSLLPKSLTELRLSMTKEVLLPLLVQELPSLKNVFFSSIVIDCSSISRTESIFTEKTLEMSIRKILGALIPEGTLIVLEPSCPTHLRFENHIMGLKWDNTKDLSQLSLPPSITTMDFHSIEKSIMDICIACPNVEILKLPHFKDAGRIPPKVRSLELRTGFGFFFDSENLEELELEELSFPNATIIHKQCLSRINPKSLRSIKLGCLPVVSTSRYHLTRIEFTQFTEWHSVNLLPRTLTWLSLNHPFPNLSQINEQVIRSLPSKLEYLQIPYMPAVGWGLLNASLKTIELQFASIINEWFMISLDSPEFDSSSSLEFQKALPTLGGQWKVTNPLNKNGFVHAALFDYQIQENTRLKKLVLNDHTLTYRSLSKLPRALEYLDFGPPNQISSLLPENALSMLPPNLTTLIVRSYIVSYGDIAMLPETLRKFEARVSEPKQDQSSSLAFPPHLESISIISPVSLSTASPILPSSLRSLQWKSAPGSSTEVTEFVDILIPLLPKSLESLTVDLPRSVVRSLQGFPDHIIHMNCGPNLIRPASISPSARPTGLGY